VPVQTISRLQNTINGTDWVPEEFELPFLPQLTNGKGFPAETLRFDGAEIHPKLSIFGIRWYDIVYKFVWNTIYSDWWTEAGNHMDKKKYVGWNMLIGQPGVGLDPDGNPGLGFVVGGVVGMAAAMSRWYPLGYYRAGWFTSAAKAQGLINLIKLGAFVDPAENLDRNMYLWDHVVCPAVGGALPVPAGFEALFSMNAP
jgi:hypothetical protein